ncbi:sodium-dependent transporter [Halorhodospira halophila]|uniref:Transporter n=1 Tax=Halorhodospira halophila (strain DSM 244 / SL1) TaxID=349124 RepID=A1WZP5_HALHL|nr:sodium-dependent transporter [Halorhodospira halophila]ABM63157.1 sodium:neurotransmitter symporter [Halorhodospira halophila SL1]MBK1729336.1 sodium-dependent transporter [Halorhodospira halophila]
MKDLRQSIHGEWGSRWAFILAATGSAVGLGNIWRFPYVVGEYGGGAFILIYLACILAIGIPVMMAEILIGRRGRQSPINTMRALPAEFGAGRWWQILGWLGVIAGFLVLSFYSVVAGWSLAYVPYTAAGTFTGTETSQVEAIFNDLLASPWQMLFWHTVFMGATAFIVLRGVQNGLERAVRLLMPILFLLLLVMVGYGMGAGAFVEAMDFMFSPDFSAIGGDAVLVAMGQAFFTLSLGLGAIMAYGSYLSKRSSIPGNSGLIAGADTVIALLAGLAIFPIVLAAGLDPDSGPGLVFVTLSYGFGQMPLGALFGTLFFLLLSFAALTSAISIMEPATAYLVETRGWKRPKAAAAVAAAAWLVGIGSLLAFNVWAGFTIAGLNFQELAEYLSTSVMLPLGGLLMALFAGWVLPRSVTTEELALPDWVYRGWLVLVRFVVPAAILVVFANSLGLLG